MLLFQPKFGADGLDPNPWYIYECIPFLKDVPGYDDYSDDKHNTILVSKALFMAGFLVLVQLVLQLLMLKLLMQLKDAPKVHGNCIQVRINII